MVARAAVILLRYLLEHSHGVMPTYIKSGQADDGAHAAILRIGNGALMADHQAYPRV